MEVAKESEVAQVKSPGPTQTTKSRARSRSRARARQRSLSQLPSYRIKSSCSEGEEEEGEIVEVPGALETSISVQKEAKDLGKKFEDKSEQNTDEEEYTYSESPQEEHIWLLPKSVRRAKKLREQRAV
ncbi:hypothetical protein YC2023_031122 [Brassica napus]